MSVNRYAGTCEICSARVPAKGGVLRQPRPGRFTVRHLVCDRYPDGVVPAHWVGSPVSGHWEEARVIRPQVVATTFASGATVIRNARGRCEDAPCCGCCD
jgi:hypothetical protein